MPNNDEIIARSIDELNELASVANGDRLVVEHAGVAYSANAGLFKGPKGDAGAAGQNGTNGQNGVSPTINVSKTGKVTTFTIVDVNGTQTAQVSDGNDGVDGTVEFDELTPAQKAELKGEDGEGVIPGGTTGQVLAKASNDDYDTVWLTPSGGGGSGLPAVTSADNGKILRVVNGAWALVEVEDVLEEFLIYDSTTDTLDIELDGTETINNEVEGM